MSAPATLPATISFYGAYTSPPNASKWNFDGNNDASLVAYMRDVIAPLVGKAPNLYEVFVAWNDPTQYGNNAAWCVSNMMASGFAGVPMISWKYEFGAPYQWDDLKALTDVTAGHQDQAFRDMIDGTYKSGCRLAFFRPSYEYNFDFMPDSMGWGADHQAAWKAATEHTFRFCRSYAASKPGLVWINVLCPAMGSGGQPALTVVPDVTTWDVWGPDFYGTYYGSGSKSDPAVRQAWWNNGFDCAWQQSSAFALAHGKPMMLCETGVGGPAGVNNDAVWIDWLADRIVAFRAAKGRWWGLIMWDINPGDGQWRYSDGSQPLVASALKRRMTDIQGDAISTTNPLGAAPPVVTPPPPVVTPPPPVVTPPPPVVTPPAPDPVPDPVATAKAAAADAAKSASAAGTAAARASISATAAAAAARDATASAAAAAQAAAAAVAAAKPVPAVPPPVPVPAPAPPPPPGSTVVVTDRNGKTAVLPITQPHSFYINETGLVGNVYVGIGPSGVVHIVNDNPNLVPTIDLAKAGVHVVAENFRTVLNQT